MAPTRTLSRAALIRAARESSRSEREVEFELPRTGGVALVRRLDLMELVGLDAFPADLQGVVNKMLESQIGGADSQLNLPQMLASMGGVVAAVKTAQQLADCAALVGFLDPRLVATEADVVDPDVELALTSIEPADRLAYWEWCQGSEVTSVLAETFPQPPVSLAPAQPIEGLRAEPGELSVRTA